LEMRKQRRLWDTYRFPGFRPRSTVQGIFGDPKARVMFLNRRGKKVFAVPAAISSEDGTIASGVGFATWGVEIIEFIWISRCVGSIARGAGK
jgi:hypothetical protein